MDKLACPIRKEWLGLLPKPPHHSILKVVVRYESEDFTHSHSLTPCSGLLPEKLTGPQLLKEFSKFYGTRRSITVFTTARHLSLSSARSTQSMPPAHFSKIHFITRWHYLSSRRHANRMAVICMQNVWLAPTAWRGVATELCGSQQ